MTVKELMKILKRAKPDATVYLFDTDNGGVEELDEPVLAAEQTGDPDEDDGKGELQEHDPDGVYFFYNG